jgi:putative salt-induced outer membrane protein YdiY
MIRLLVALLTVTAWSLFASGISAQQPGEASPGLVPAIAPAPATPPTDLITLKDGSMVYGEVVELADGKLKVKTKFGTDETISIKWENVTKLAINRPIPVRLKDGTTIIGTVQEGKDGTLELKAEPLAGPLTVALDQVTGINPPAKPPVVYEGNLTLGFAGADGNSRYQNISGLAEFVARSEWLRLTLIGRYVYGEADGNLNARNSRATMKLDFFLSKRFYIFASTYFEQDTFQDLQLRTAISSGPGYQFIEKGDYASPYLKDMQLYGEAGLAYFNEDFKQKPDQTSFRARLSVKWDWPMIKDVFSLFQYTEFFPSIQDSNDYYLTTDQGMMIHIWKNFVFKPQLTYRYNNAPPPGVKPSDTLYLLTFGYSIGK